MSTNEQKIKLVLSNYKAGALSHDEAYKEIEAVIEDIVDDQIWHRTIGEI